MRDGTPRRCARRGARITSCALRCSTTAAAGSRARSGTSGRCALMDSTERCAALARCLPGRKREAGEGAAVAGLFSEIGEALYQRLGFVRVTLDEVDVHVERRDGAPAMLVRAGDERDLPALAAMHASRSSN